jgi:hypothetical protein
MYVTYLMGCKDNLSYHNNLWIKKVHARILPVIIAVKGTWEMQVE